MHNDPDPALLTRLAAIEAAVATIATQQGNFMSAASQSLEEIKANLNTANASITNMRGDIGRLNDAIQGMTVDAASVEEIKTLSAEVAANAGAGDAEGGEPTPA